MSGRGWKEQLADASEALGFEAPKPPGAKPEAAPKPVAKPKRAPTLSHDYASPYRRHGPIASSPEPAAEASEIPPSTRRVSATTVNSGKWRGRVRHRHFLWERGIPYLGSARTASATERTNVCWNCRERVSSRVHHICSHCKLCNIICPKCGACGCASRSTARVTRSDAERDDIERWIVLDLGRLVFPNNVAGEIWAEVLAVASNRRAAYQDYLASPTWKNIRSAAIQDARFRCARCSAGDALQVHHKTYDRVGGKELPEDLEVLCERCHYNQHFGLVQSYLEYLSGAAPA